MFRAQRTENCLFPDVADHAQRKRFARGGYLVCYPIVSILRETWEICMYFVCLSLLEYVVTDSDLTEKKRVESICHVLKHGKSGFCSKLCLVPRQSYRNETDLRFVLESGKLSVLSLFSFRLCSFWTGFIYREDMSESQRTSFMAGLKCVLLISGFIVLPVSSKPSFQTSSSDQSCDFVKTDSDGEILSPNYPQQYPAGKECSWTIVMPLFQKVVVVFETFNLEPIPPTEIGCDISDNVEVYDGLRSVGKYCAGNIPPRQITSSSHTLRVVFKSDNRTTQNFHGRFRAIYSSCGGFYTEASGNLASPRYPSRFPADIQCHWNIRVPSDYVIELRFIDFNMDGMYPCNVDYVKVLDGLNTNDTEIGHFCSTRPPGQTLIRSTGNKMSLEFKSYKESNSRGFQAHYSRVPHCTGFLKSDYGRFTSPGYPGRRRMDKECNWFIEVTEGKIASVMFEFFDVDSVTSTFSTPGDCQDDYVEVFDGTGDNEKSLGRFCTINNKPMGMVWATGSQMLVRLKTSFKNNGNGFLASYYGIDPDFEACDEFDHQLLFTCNNGKKIQCQLKCDGTNDCPDASDERRCKHLQLPSNQKSNDIRNYVIIILSIAGSALSVVCIGFIVDRLRKKRAARPRRRTSRQRRPRLRISTTDDAALMEEPSSPPPPYELGANGSACSPFDVSIIQPYLSDSGRTGARRDVTPGTHNCTNSQTQSRVLAAGNQENSSTDTRTQEITSTPTQYSSQEIQTASSFEEGDAISVNASVATISPSESISSLNDTTPLIRSESVIEL